MDRNPPSQCERQRRDHRPHPDKWTQLWQGVTRERMGAFVTEEQRRQLGYSANRMQLLG